MGQLEGGPLEAGFGAAEEGRLKAERVLDQAVDSARRGFGPRFLAAFAIGSLAHGGFSALASDVDLAVLLDDPLDPDDGARLELSTATARRIPFGDRLSVFWGSPETLRTGIGGRFPAHDLLDLAAHGRLLAGRDVRGGMRRPGSEELLVAGAEFILTTLAPPGSPTEKRLADPASVLSEGPRVASKLALFPVRFLYTAQTGRLGLTEPAVVHYLATHGADDPRAALVLAAARWRFEWDATDDAAGCLLGQARALYSEVVADHIPRLRSVGRYDLAAGLVSWRAVLAGQPV